MFFLLPNKEYLTYFICMKKMESLGVINVKKLHLDFEISAIKAVNQVWPDAKVIGCDTH